MESYFSIGKITVNLPDHSSKEFFIFEDLATLFNLESNYTAESFIKKKIKENGITKKMDIDSETDFVSIRTKNASGILEMAILINEIANVPINLDLIKDLKKK